MKKIKWNHILIKYFFRSNISNPQVKNTVTFKTITYEIFLLGLLSTLFLVSQDTSNIEQIDETYILIVLNCVNIVSNIFLLTYLFHNQEALEYAKNKNRELFTRFSKIYRKNKINSSTAATNGRVFVINTNSNDKRGSLVDFKNDIEMVDVSSNENESEFDCKNSPDTKSSSNASSSSPEKVWNEKGFRLNDEKFVMYFLYCLKKVASI